MTATLGQLAQLVNGTVVGDANAVIQAARPLQEAQSGDITFLEKVDKLPALSASQAGAAVVPLGVLLQDRNLIQVADPL
ncbi:MAG TPA: LpxD N-terminal domain-containing protein, partial [Gemmataceae bacterium]|nr:LpxD N-terminal domain-containing protein [Gemmataceae bacterium]